jgi:hypothetical protein
VRVLLARNPRAQPALKGHNWRVAVGARLKQMALCIAAAGATSLGCEYAGLVRPSMLSELTPPVVRLVNELPDLDAPNKATVAQLYAVG